MSAWGTPVPEDSAPAQASAWGSPVDEGADTPVQPATPYGAQSSEQIVQDQTGIKPYGSPLANAAAGVGRVLAAPFTGLAAGAKGLFTPPNIANPEEQTALDNYGSLGLGMHRAFVAPAEAAHQTATTLRSQGHPLLAAGAELGALPILGPLGQSLGQRAAAGDMTGAFTEGLATAAGPAALKEALPALGGAQGTLRQRLRPSSSPIIIPPVEQAAASTARAINPPGGVPEGFEDALANQTPGIKNFAARTSNPLNTRWEFAKAALGHAQELNDFYDKEILAPTAGRQVPIEGTGYQGENTRTVGGQQTTSLGDIDKRLGKINDLLRPAYDKNNAGASMTALEKSGLQDEANALRTTLYNELAKDTGLRPEEIRQLRQSYGQSYDIASKTDAARRRVVPGSGVPTSKEGLIQSVLEKSVGGKDAISDRAVQSSLQRFKPALSPIEQWRNTVSGTRAQTAAQATANQAAAQQEFLHGTGLTQSAQDAATQRAQVASGVRDQNNTLARTAAQQEVLHAHDLQTAAQEAAAGRRLQRSQYLSQATDRNQLSAQQEVLHAHALETAAQDAAALRAQQASGARGANVQATQQMPAVASPSNVPGANTRIYGGRTFVQDPKTGWWQPQ